MLFIGEINYNYHIYIKIIRHKKVWIFISIVKSQGVYLRDSYYTKLFL